jgi:hypothetical protein
MGYLVDVVVMGDVFCLVYNFHMPLAWKGGCPSSAAGCDIALVFIFMCVGLMAIFLWCYVLLRIMSGVCYYIS